MRGVPTDPTTFRLERLRDGVTVLTPDRPDRLNALTATMFAELGAAASALDREERLRLLVLTGAGTAALLHNQEVTSYDAALELENRGQVLLTPTDDMPEALHAFTEGCPARFTGR